MAHITNKQDVPPVYANEAQPSTSTIPNIHHREIDQYEEMERQARIRNDESMAREIHSLKEAFKNIQTGKGHEGLEYEDLCMHPDVRLPIGYKVPKFDLFDGKGNPRAHLRSYCDKWLEWMQTNKSVDNVNVTCNETNKQNPNDEQDFEEYEEDSQPEELTEELEHFENKPKPNLEETEAINLGDAENVRETRIGPI
ncbi:hypothetical protein K7X08_006518 [Anisodus acutangulus]|uniref:Uncharacterized protein n=1 Tax=Anisodus acutangulus TaxID=402998 RepID=A0A9Q1N1K0_9SOLA|nr:hypothetical protein K7X08_006518 [Anisodus acutangulus]